MNDIEKWFAENQKRFVRDIDVIGEYVLQDDKTFGAFLNSSNKKQFLPYIEGFLKRKISQDQEEAFQDKYGYIKRYLELYVKPNFEKDSKVFYNNIIISQLLKQENKKDNQNRKSNEDLHAYFKESFPIASISNTLDREYTNMLEAKKLVSIVELEGMIRFYTTHGHHYLDKEKSLTIFPQAIRLGDYCTTFSQKSRETFLLQIFEDTLKSNNINYTVQFVRNDEMLTEYEKKDPILCKKKLGGLVCWDSSKIYINREYYLHDGEDVPLSQSFESIKTFNHELQHIIQYIEMANVTNEYANSIKIKETIIENIAYSEDPNGCHFYNENYDFSYKEGEAEALGQAAYFNIVQMYAPFLLPFVEEKCTSIIRDKQNQCHSQKRIYNDKIGAVDTIFGELVPSVKELLQVHPELQKEYNQEGIRKTTGELIIERERLLVNHADEKEIQYYDQLIFKRDMSLPEWFSDCTDLIMRLSDPVIASSGRNIIARYHLPKFFDILDLARSNGEEKDYYNLIERYNTGFKQFRKIIEKQNPNFENWQQADLILRELIHTTQIGMEQKEDCKAAHI